MVVDAAQSEPRLEHKERHENESGAVKTECAEIVKPTLCLVMVGDTTNHQSSNQRRVKRRSEPILLGRFDGSAFKLVVLNQLVVEESEIAFARIKIGFMARKNPLGICPKVANHLAEASRLDKSAKASLKISLS